MDLNKLKEAQKLVAAENGRLSHKAKITKYGKKNISKVMSHIRKGKKLIDFKVEVK